MVRDEGKSILLRTILILAFSIVTGYLLLSLSYLIPERFYDDREIGSAVLVFIEEQEYPVESFSGRKLDNYTDALMLSEATTYIEEKSPFEMAVETPFQRGESSWGPLQAFIQLNTDASAKGINISYSRYWHGYLIFLKPLFAFFTYFQIRNINTYVFFALLAAAFILLYERKGNLVLPFFVMILYLAPTAVVNSLQYSSDCYIMVIGILLFLWNPRNIFQKRNNVYTLFLLLGIWTSYLDLLTAPTISLTVLLCLVCSDNDENDQMGNHNWKMLVVCAGIWFIGYAVMWAGKWAIALFVQKQTFLDSLIHSMKFRSASVNEQGESIIRLQGLSRNIETLVSIKYVNLVLIGTICFYLRPLLLRIKSGTRVGRCKKRLLYLIPFTIPLLWMFVMSNHSYNHHWFTYRTLAPCVFCLLCVLSETDQHISLENSKRKIQGLGSAQ